MHELYQVQLKSKQRIVGQFGVRLVLAILGCIASVIVLGCDTVAPGLEFFFLLPLAFSVACMVFMRPFSDAKDSFGLLILYALIVLRYVVSPVLTALSGSLVPGVSTSAAGLRYAVFIMILELFVVVISINRIWKPIVTISAGGEDQKSFKVTWVGSSVCLGLAGIVLVRGNLPNVIEHLSVGSVYSIASSALYTYDMSTVLMLKAFIFIAIASWASKRYYATGYSYKRFFYLIVALIAALGNSLVYDATARSSMVMCAMSSLTVLLYCFGKRIKKILPIIAVAGFVFVWSLFSYGTLGVESGENFFDRPEHLSELSRVAELYSNGISTEAHAFDMYDRITSQMGIASYISELISSNSIFSLPGFWVIGRLVGSIPSIQKLFNQTLYGQAFIAPNAGLAMYSAGWLFGWLLDIVFHILLVVGIYFFYRKRKQTADVAYQYLYSYCEMICAFTLMNNVMIAVSLLSAVPFLLFVLLKLNSLGMSSAGRIKRS